MNVSPENVFFGLVLSSTLVWLFAGIVAHSWRKASAASRHRVWGVSMLVVLVSPAVMQLVPIPDGLRFPVDSASESTDVAALEDQFSSVSASDRNVQEMRITDSNFESQSLAGRSETFDQPVEFATADFADHPAIQPGIDDSPIEPSESASAPQISWQTIGASLWRVWLVGFVVGLLWYSISFLRSRRLRYRSLILNSGSDVETFASLCRQLKIRHEVQLGASAEATVPFVIGWNKPVVLLPTGYGNWSADRFSAVVTHELMHIQRADLVWQTIARFSLILTWFHPFAWLATRRLRIERELACDDAVLMEGRTASDYANHLVEIAAAIGTSTSAYAPNVAMASGSQVEHRVRSILDTTVSRKPASQWKTAVSVVTAAVALLIAAILSPSVANPTSLTVVPGAAVVDENNHELEAAPLAEDPETRKAQIAELTQIREARASTALQKDLVLITDRRSSLTDIVRTLTRQYRVTFFVDDASFFRQGITTHHIPPVQLSGMSLGEGLQKLLATILHQHGRKPIVAVENGAVLLSAELSWDEPRRTPANLSAVAFQSMDSNGLANTTTVLENKGTDGVYFTMSNSKGFCQVLGEGVTEWHCSAIDQTGLKMSQRYHRLYTKKPKEPFIHTLGPVDSFAVVVTDQNGQPISDATVGIQADFQRCKLTDSDGVATFTVPKDFKYLSSIHAVKPGYALGFISYRPQWAKQVRDTFRLRLNTAKPVTIKAITDGKPMAGIAITPSYFKRKASNGEEATATANTLAWWNTHGGIDSTVTDQNGEVVFDWLPDDCEISFNVGNRDFAGSRLTLADLTGDKFDFPLTKLIVVSGRLTDVSGKPVPNASMIAPDQSASGFQTNDAGEYSLRLPPDTEFFLDVMQAGNLRARSPVYSTGKTEQLNLPDIVARPASQIVGQIKYKSGQPVPGVPLNLFVKPPDGVISNGYGLTYYSDSDGQFSIPVNAGVYELDAEWGAREMQPFTVKESEDYKIELTIAKKIPFRGRVLHEFTGNPVVNTSFIGECLNHDPSRWYITTDSEGRFESVRDSDSGLVYLRSNDNSLAGCGKLTADGLVNEFKVARPLSYEIQVLDSKKRPMRRRPITYGVIANVTNSEGQTRERFLIEPAKRYTTADGGLFLSDVVVGAPYTFESAEGQKGTYLPQRQPKAISPPSVILKTPSGQSPMQSGSDSNSRLSLEQTIEQLRQSGQIAAADFLAGQLESVQRNMAERNYSYIFGRLTTATDDSARLCDAQMAIHSSGWFIGAVRYTNSPVEFRMWRHRPAKVFHDGEDGTIASVGDVKLLPLTPDELGSVRGSIQLANDVDPSQVSVKVTPEHPPTNTPTGGTNGHYPWPEKESVSLDSNLQLQKQKLNPSAHYISIRALGHLPFRQKFEVESGRQTDLGELKLVASPRFKMEIRTAPSPDFSKAKRRNVSVYAGEEFETNPGPNTWVEAGQMRINERDGKYSLHCGMYGLMLTDLGVAELDDFPMPSHAEGGRPYQGSPPIQSDHVYLISHTYNKPDRRSWKHWTLLKIEQVEPNTDPQ